MVTMAFSAGSGAFATTAHQAQALASSLVTVAQGAGLPARALVTDMNQVLGHTAGNALEVQESISFLTGVQQDPRLLQVTLALCAELLHLGGLFATHALSHAAALHALTSGTAAERFARMVAAQGGPADVLQNAHLAAAPVVQAVPALQSGWLAAMDVRALGQAVVALGGGRTLPGQSLDPRVGLSQVLPLGTHVQAGQALALVHAGSADAAAAAVLAVQQAVVVGSAAAPSTPGVVVQQLAA